jgi:hypothetical protein
MTAPTLELSPQSATLQAAPSGGGLVAAIASVMAEVDTVAKRGVNEFHRYRLRQDGGHPQGNHAAAR